jgi:hypothetical protein
MPNRLASELSPYLRQHADNPVDWRPWGPEALAAAAATDRPILLSVGYSACHWCHVMAHECFEDPAIAALMNELFVNIKVDREERPDLDQLYQSVCQLLTQQGGWPLTVFLTPDGAPFYAGTYFPPTERYGRPAFPRVLQTLAELWREQRGRLLTHAGELTAALGRLQAAAPAAEAPGVPELDSAWRAVGPHFDRRRGGLGEAPKFPNPGLLELALRHHARTGDAEALELAVQALRAMRRGGIWDQLGGGFHRYSVDAEWAIPHFEKMLYDNALLAPLYLAAWQATGAADLLATARETLDWLLNEMAAPGGGFHSATDADSEGAEGRYFVWTAAEIEGLLPPEQARLFAARFGVTAQGNFEHGATCLHLAAGIEELAAEFRLERATVEAQLAAARATLLAVRARRPAPGLDNKVLATWNGLALGALARAALALGDPRYLAAAQATAGFLTQRLMAGGRLARLAVGGQVRGQGFLDDYGNVAGGLLELFAADGQGRWLRAAESLLATVLTEFRDDDAGDFFQTPADGERLVLRPKDLHDHAVPSGLAAVAAALLKLGRLSPDGPWRAALEQVLAAHGASLGSRAWGRADLLNVLDGATAEPCSVLIVGAGPAAAALRATAAASYAPNLVLRLQPQPPDPLAPEMALLDGRPAAWVCAGSACRPPVTEAAALRALLWRR